MRLLWIAARVVLIGLAFATLVFIPVFLTGPSGTSVDLTGALIDVAALVLLIASAVTLWRDRRRSGSA